MIYYGYYRINRETLKTVRVAFDIAQLALELFSHAAYYCSLHIVTLTTFKVQNDDLNQRSSKFTF